MTLMPIGRTKDTTRYAIVPSGVGGKGFQDSVSSEYGQDSSQAFDEDEILSPIDIEIRVSNINMCLSAQTTCCLSTLKI